MFSNIKHQIEAIYGTKIKIEGIMNFDKTGAFEIKIINDHQETLIHSKLKGDGIIDRKNILSIIEKINRVVK